MNLMGLNVFYSFYLYIDYIYHGYLTFIFFFYLSTDYLIYYNIIQLVKKKKEYIEILNLVYYFIICYLLT
jgi:hypothetical protein